VQKFVALHLAVRELGRAAVDGAKITVPPPSKKIASCAVPNLTAGAFAAPRREGMTMAEIEITIVPAGGSRQADVFTAYWGERTSFLGSARKLLEAMLETCSSCGTKDLKGSAPTEPASLGWQVPRARL